MNRDEIAVQGVVIDASDPQLLRQALDAAFDYRGDVTIRRKSSPEPVEGYLFDRVTGDRLEECKVRILPSSGEERLTIPYADIAELTFSGRDTAAGKSFETWMKKYVRRKLAGQEASIEPEPL